TSFNNSDAGLWVIDIYIETYSKNCAGVSSTITTSVNSINFTVLDPTVIGSPCAPLALGIDYFNAFLNNHEVTLKWQNNSVDLIHTYTVEKSTNGINFISIGNIPASLGKRQYQFIDQDILPVNGQYFYRIKAVTTNQKIGYSSIVKVLTQGNNSSTIQIANGTSPLLIKYMNFKKGQYTFNLFSSNGKLLGKKIVPLTDGVNISGTTALELQLPHGMYWLTVLNEYGQIVAKKNLYR
ncbi:MAG: hypothetical protein ACOYKE_15200, partial [Ferruginibacter sp.]